MQRCDKTRGEGRDGQPPPRGAAWKPLTRAGEWARSCLRNRRRVDSRRVASSRRGRVVSRRGRLIGCLVD